MNHHRRKEYGGQKVDLARRLKDLERENARLKKIMAKKDLDIAILKEALVHPNNSSYLESKGLRQFRPWSRSGAHRNYWPGRAAGMMYKVNSIWRGDP